MDGCDPGVICPKHSVELSGATRQADYGFDMKLEKFLKPLFPEFDGVIGQESIRKDGPREEGREC